MADVGDPYIGMRLADRYQLLERIGEGGMGVVYRARQLHLDRAVAIKVLRRRALRDPARLALFRKEAEALARLQHPNTVRIFELGTFDGGPFVAMELLEGRTLAVEIARTGTMPVARTLKILAQLCSSLEEAHRAGITHGDIKPQNVFLLDVEGATDHVKLVDFSLAQLAGSEPDDARFMGTPGYASPELLGGGAARPASDVHACGVVAFQMLTGALPSSNRAEMIRALLAQVPESVAVVVLRATEHDVALRYPGVAELRRDSDRAAVAGDARPPLRRDAP
ncbi:MAG TPA: serine/threonine-protein kinase, partial [Kofleriaceae bacterium]|nr:serine/threonine-protein kinase [Kofleriaceae bacterium]